MMKRNGMTHLSEGTSLDPLIGTSWQHIETIWQKLLHLSCMQKIVETLFDQPDLSSTHAVAEGWETPVMTIITYQLPVFVMDRIHEEYLSVQNLQGIL